MATGSPKIVGLYNVPNQVGHTNHAGEFTALPSLLEKGLLDKM